MFTTQKWQPIRFAKGIALFPRLSILALILFASTRLDAAYVTDSIPYGLDYPTGLFYNGDTVTIAVWAGSSSFMLSEVAGFDLTYSLTSHAVFPTSVTPDLSFSWIGDNDELQASATLDESSGRLTFSGLNASISRQGAGEIFRFSLICTSNGVSADELLVDGGGGGNVIIQVDDLGLRLQAPSDPAVMIYPNPSPGKVQVKGERFQKGAWVLMDLNGKELGRGTQFPINLRTLAIGQGQYVLLLRSDNGRYFDFVLSYEP